MTGGEIKLGLIKEYLSTIDFKSDGWSYHTIEEDLKKLTGERPTLRINRERDVMLSEDAKSAKEIEVIASVDIIYTEVDNKIKKYTILI